MPADAEADPEFPQALVKAMREGAVVPFAGAGCSRAIQGGGKPLFPLWGELLRRAATRLDKDSAGIVQGMVNKNRLLEAATEARSALKNDWFSFLREELDPDRKRVDEGSLALPKAIWGLGSKLVITTNYDRVLEWTCPEPGMMDVWDIQEPHGQAKLLGASELERYTTWHLHGTITNPTDLILTTDGYHLLYPEEGDTEQRYKAALTSLKGTLAGRPVLFIGFSFQDDSFVQFLRGVDDDFAHAGKTHFVLVQKKEWQHLQEKVRDLPVHPVLFEDFGEPMLRRIQAIARLRDGSGPPPPRPAPAPVPLKRRDPPPPLPKLEESERGGSVIVGRKGKLTDVANALTSAIARGKGERTSGSIQMFWYHGFGGVGKSSLLRCAYVDAEARGSEVAVALVDWYQSRWRQPLVTKPVSPQDVFRVIATRLEQLYGSELVEPYWQALDAVTARAARHEVELTRFEATRSLLAREEPAKSDGLPELATAEAAQQQLELAALRRVLADAGILDEDLAVQNHRVKEAWNNPELVEQFFGSWITRCRPHQELCDEVVRPTEHLAMSLRACLKRACERRPLLLIVDTCEVLSKNVDRWFRNLVFPLLDGTLPLLLLIGSRHPPDQAQADLPEEFWRAVACDSTTHLTPGQIAEALQAVHPGSSRVEALAGTIHKVTLGLPLAVGMMVALFRTDPDVFESWNLPEPDSNKSMKEQIGRITRTVADRILLHLDGDPSAVQLLRDTVALALQRDEDEELFRLRWGPSADDRLERLRTRYGFLAGDRLHLTVREYLRRAWHERPHRELPTVLEELWAANQKLLPPPNVPFSPGGAERMLETLNLQVWREGEAALPRFVPALVLFLAHDHDWTGVTDLIAEVPARSPRAQELKRKLLAWGDVPPYADPWDVRGPFEWLLSQPTEGWSRQEVGSRTLLRALGASEQDQHREAIAAFEEAFGIFGSHLPRSRKVQAAYLKCVARDPGSNLAQAEAWASRAGFDFRLPWSEEIDALLTRSVKEPSKSSELVTEAERLCRRATGFERQRQPAGDGLRSLTKLELQCGYLLWVHAGKYDEAVRVYEDIRAPYDPEVPAILWASYLCIMAREGDIAGQIEMLEALPLPELSTGQLTVILFRLTRADVTGALRSIREKMCRECVQRDFSRQSAAALAFLAESLACLGQTKRALEHLERALERADSADDKNVVAFELYVTNHRLEVAERLASEALKVNPAELATLQTKSAILIRREAWAQAEPLFVEYVSRIPDGSPRKTWEEDLLMYRDAVRLGRAAQVAEWLERSGRPLWSDLSAALRACAGGGEDPRARVAEFVRQLKGTAWPERWPRS